jgi:iron complex transport system ATP-binding protein
MIDVRNLSFAYTAKPVLKDVSFSIRKGHTVGVLGTNGSGKSTLLKCIGNVLNSKDGTILFEGVDLKGYNRKTLAQKVSYVSQSSSDFGISVFETVLLGRSPYFHFVPAKRDLDTVKELLALMGLEDIAHRDVSEVSGGEYQKVMLARAMAQEPEVLLLDEPTNHLDMKNQLEVMDLLAHLVDAHGITLVVSLHDVNLAFEYVDKILLLKENSLFFFGKKDQVTQSHLENVYDVALVEEERDGKRRFFPVQRRSR